jgi:hypothetical protein
MYLLLQRKFDVYVCVGCGTWRIRVLNGTLKVDKGHFLILKNMHMRAAFMLPVIFLKKVASVDLKSTLQTRIWGNVVELSCRATIELTWKVQDRFDPSAEFVRSKQNKLW